MLCVLIIDFQIRVLYLCKKIIRNKIQSSCQNLHKRHFSLYKLSPLPFSARGLQTFPRSIYYSHDRERTTLTRPISFPHSRKRTTFEVAAYLSLLLYASLRNMSILTKKFNFMPNVESGGVNPPQGGSSEWLVGSSFCTDNEAGEYVKYAEK